MNPTPLSLAAVLAIVGVIGVGAWQVRSALITRTNDLTASAAAPAGAQGQGNADENLAVLLGESATSSTPEEIASIGTDILGSLTAQYAVLAQTDAYTPELGEQLAADAAANARVSVPYTPYAPDSIRTDLDVSLARVRAYRTALQTSLSPLKDINSYELDLFRAYTQTGDARKLSALHDAAARYRDAASRSAQLTIPADATAFHLGILNAMQKFAATLDMMADHADDPVTSVVLLRSFTEAEADMRSAFDALNAYFAHKSS